MKNIKYIPLLLLTILFGCKEETLELLEYGSISGRVVEAESFNPIENVKIEISPSNNTVFTDADGYFLINDIEVGDYSVSASKKEYLTAFEAATVTKNSEVNVIFEMEDDDALNKPPGTPKLLSPENDTLGLTNNVLLSWEAIDEDLDDVLKYTITVYNDYDNSRIVVENIEETMFELKNLKFGVKYFWQVSVTDDINEPVLSEVFNFKIKSDPNNRYTYTRKSENGNFVIYSASISDGNLVNEYQLTSDSRNSWRARKNDRADLIAFLSMDENEAHIYTMGLNGFNINKVTSDVPLAGFNLNEMDFTWSRNGERILYSHYNKLYEINKDGSGLRMVYETLDGSYISEVAWSNDESLIVLKTNDLNGYNAEVMVVDSNGNLVKSILKGVEGAVGGLDISANNKYVLYTHDISGFEESGYRMLDSRIFIYDLNNDTVESLSNRKMNGTNDLDPRFSPNEAEVIFVNTSNDGISTKNIMKVNFSDGFERKLIIPNAFMPDWE